MRQVFKITFIFACILAFACAQAEQINLVKTSQLPFDELPSHIEAASFLPNGNLYIIYIDNDDSVFKGIFTRRELLLSEEGKVLRSFSINNYDEEKDSSSVQIIVGKDNFQRELYLDEEKDAMYRLICSFDGNILSPAFDIIELEDEQKYYAYNAWPFTIKFYTFAENKDVPLEIIYQPTGFVFPDSFAYGEYAFCSDGNSRFFLADRQEKSALRVRSYDACNKKADIDIISNTEGTVYEAAFGSETLYLLTENKGGYNAVSVDLNTDEYAFYKIEAPEGELIQSLFALSGRLVIETINNNNEGTLHLLDEHGNIENSKKTGGAVLWVSPDLHEGKIAAIVKDSNKVLLKEFALSGK